MQTSFTAEQLRDPDLAEANTILRKCVHCGFCTATCPTYVLLGDELDSPRGRIYLIKDMLEGDKPATERVVRHVDRCLSCLSCMTTCPSGVNYMHLVDQARAHIEKTYRRPLAERVLRGLLAAVLPYPTRFAAVARLGSLVRPLASVLPGKLGAMAKLLPERAPAASLSPQVFPAQGKRRMRVALLAGCVQRNLAPEINAATIRLLTRHGCEVVVAKGAGCCGALTHHLGKGADDAVKANVTAWLAEKERDGLDAIVVNASGCGTMVKDYGYLLRADPAWAGKAGAVSSLAKDVTEVMTVLGLAGAKAPEALKVAYHSACSLQHGQGITDEPKRLLRGAGFDVREPAEAHLCCGSAGTYNLLQPEIAERLRMRKAANLERTGASVVAAGNIGCMVQIAGGSAMPVVHTVELLDWATGGPKPVKLGAPARSSAG
ncbi:MAG: glycolate oxidase subunit GlcF [Alphaproteobacteria bacterium]